MLVELTRYARTNIVLARGYHRVDPSKAKHKYFWLNADWRVEELTAVGEVVEAIKSLESVCGAGVDVTPPVCGEYPSNLEAMLEEGAAPVTSRDHALV